MCQQEQASKESDYAAQQHASEERLQDTLREQRKRVKDRRERRMKLRELVNGEGSLFAAPVDSSFRSQATVPLPPADHELQGYVDLLGGGLRACLEGGA